MLILASHSSVRAALLRQAGLRFSVVSAAIDERAIEVEALTKGASADAIATRLASAKALSVPAGNALVIGADQVLECEGALLHKPQTLADAASRLDALSGRTHWLHTAVALARSGELLWSYSVSARLAMRAFDAAERDRVLASDPEALVSAGAYRLEGPAIRLFDSIEGDWFSMLGLPLLPLLGALRQHAPDAFAP